MRQRSLTHPVVLVALVLILGSAAVVLAVWVLPLVLTRHPSAGMSSAARLKSQNAVRTPVIAALAVIGAATITAAYATRSTRLTLEGQLADRYSKAIDQIGADKALDVRIGGIYALERIAADSPRDHPTVIEVLATYVREHSHEQWPEAEPPPHQPWWRHVSRGAAPRRLTRPDVQAAVTVIGRRAPRRDIRRVNLSRADLTAANLTAADLSIADLTGADLTGADLTRANLTDANLTDANLNHANLAGADLTRAGLYGADLTGADLVYANLTSAHLISADLSGADLISAHLTGADLTGAKLTGAGLISADLTGADLISADLTGADLTGARWPSARPPPPGWQRDTDSRLLKKAAGDSGDAATE
jgi:hypothetical protein